MSDYNITFNGDSLISDMHHIGIEYNGNYYGVIFGNYINGGFFSIPGWNVGGELGSSDDVFWNTESISRALKNKKAAKQIALAIAEYGKKD